jgi:hypothetical protein
LTTVLRKTVVVSFRTALEVRAALEKLNKTPTAQVKSARGNGLPLSSFVERCRGNRLMLSCSYITQEGLEKILNLIRPFQEYHEYHIYQEATVKIHVPKNAGLEAAMLLLPGNLAKLLQYFLRACRKPRATSTDKDTVYTFIYRGERVCYREPDEKYSFFAGRNRIAAGKSVELQIHVTC